MKKVRLAKHAIERAEARNIEAHEIAKAFKLGKRIQNAKGQNRICFNLDRENRLMLGIEENANEIVIVTVFIRGPRDNGVM